MPRSRDDGGNDHAVLTFAVVAAVLLGLLLLLSQLVSASETADSQGAESAPAAVVQPPVPAGASGAVATPLLEAPTSLEAAPSDEQGIPAEAPESPQVGPPVAPSSPPPAVSARAWYVMERSCGAGLYGVNEHARLPPASTTKIVTALVVQQRARLDEIVDVTVSGSQMARRGSSVMGIEPGMKLSVRDLMFGLMLPSGNDAALALAQHIGGADGQPFLDYMNAEAARLQMHDTRFVNPHGLDGAGHHSTVHDMALAGREFLRDPFLTELSTTSEYRPEWPREAIKNGNKLLQLYPGSFGVKIGYTSAAKQTIVAAADRNGRQLILSVFASDNRYADAMAIFDWAFASLPPRCVAS